MIYIKKICPDFLKLQNAIFEFFKKTASMELELHLKFKPKLSYIYKRVWRSKGTNLAGNFSKETTFCNLSFLSIISLKEVNG
jgi:hypothetical protein